MLVMAQGTVKRKLTSFLLVCLLIAGVFAYFRWWHGPPALRKVAEIVGLQPNAYPGGVLVQEKINDTFAFYDWQHGQLRWRVSVKSDTAPVVRTACSSDGRWFAAAYFHGGQLRFSLWQEGKSSASQVHRMPDLYPAPLHRTVFGVQALGDDRFLCWMPVGANLRVLQVQGGRITARGDLVGAVPPLSDRSFASVDSSADGRVLMVSGSIQGQAVTCWDIDINGSVISGSSRALRSSPLQQVTLLTEGILLDRDSWWYFPDGRQAQSKFSTDRTVQHAGHYALFSTTAKVNPVTIYSPHDNDAWHITPPGRFASCAGIAVTPDGGHALVRCGYDTGLARLSPVEAAIVKPLMPLSSGLHRAMTEPQTVLMLYAKPGKLIAALDKLELGSVLLSPDGRAVLGSSSYDDSGRQVFLLMRW
jgi:hypothetical protein